MTKKDYMKIKYKTCNRGKTLPNRIALTGFCDGLLPITFTCH